jgi:endogenous inhibitor of DNA gyrase (YacG/DUF329 family)
MKQLDFFNKLEETKKPICPVCCNSFKKIYPWHRFCSENCRNISYFNIKKIKINCSECGVVFETKNKSKKFCSITCGQLNYRKKNKEKKKEPFSNIKENIIIHPKKNIIFFEDFDPSTVNVSLGSWENCLYCGELPNCQDHAIPFSYYSLRERNGKAGSAAGVKVKACMECNLLLSNKYFCNIVERIDYVKNSIYNRNKKILKNKQWDDDEIDELKYTIKTKVLSSEIKRREAKKRIEWSSSKKGIEYLDKIKTEVKYQFDVDHFLRTFFCC